MPWMEIAGVIEPGRHRRNIFLNMGRKREVRSTPL